MEGSKRTTTRIGHLYSSTKNKQQNKKDIYRMVLLALKKVKWPKSLLDRFSPPDAKFPPFTKISHFPAGRGDFFPTAVMLFGRLWHVSPFNHKV